MNEIENHHRVNDIFLGPLERPALKWLAGHMPAWATPDHLTVVGVLGTLIIAASYLLTRQHPGFLWLASLGLVINWFGDSLDGTLARFRHIERPRYGFYIDHAIDSFAEVLIILALGASPYVRFDLAVVALVGYLLLSNLVFIGTAVNGEFRISYGKLGPTEVRALIILANTAAFFTGNPLLHTPWFSVTLFDLVIAAMGFLLYFFSVQSAILNARALHRQGG